MPKFSRLLLSSCIFFVSVAPAIADDIIVETHKISDVTVYSDRADLTEVMKVSLPKGAHNIIIQDLPVQLLEDSLRASGKAQGNVILGALSAKQEISSEYTSAREKEITDKIKEQELQKRLLQAEKDGLATEKQFLISIGAQGANRENETITNLELNPEEWSKSAAHLGASIAQNQKAMIALDEKTSIIDDMLQKLRTELSQVRTGQKRTLSVTIPVEVSTPTTLSLNLEYQMHGAYWQPIYDARLDTRSGKLEIIQYAQVSQSTGYDWSDVNLSLSTAQPSRGADVPVVYPQWVSLLDPKEVRQFASSPRMATMQKAMRVEADQELMAGASEMVMNEAVIQEAQIDNSGFVSEYKIAGPATVKADGSSSKHLIGSFATSSTLEVQIAPQFSNLAYLVAKTKLEGDAPILAGAVNLFRDGAFIGKSYLPLLRAGNETDLSFGVDDQISVERLTLKDERSEAGLITKETSIEKHFTTKITNTRKTPVKIAVYEAVPVSQDERIRVDLISAHTTKGYQADSEDKKGVYRWEVDAAPSAENVVNLGWKISWPKDQNISGL